MARRAASSIWFRVVRLTFAAPNPGRAQVVIRFLTNCGNKNLQYLLVPSRLDAALNAMDTDRDGHIDADEWCASEF